MPVTATPAATPREPSCDLPQVAVNPTPVPCAGQILLTPTQGSSRGRQVLTRTAAVRVVGGTETAFRWTMRDQNGLPVDMSGCLCPTLTVSSSASTGLSETAETVCPYKVKFRMTEYLCLTSGSIKCFYEVEAIPVDLATGVFEVPLPATATNCPGVYFGQIAMVEMVDGVEAVVFANTFYLYVERGMWSGDISQGGPPSIAEIRMHLRDNSSQESFLLDNIRFDDAEIAMAAALPVQQWNETPPPIQTYTTRSFPFRYHWLQAICGHLFLMVAEQFRANNLKYSAAGVQVDDQDKEPNYERAAQARLDVWRSWMRTKKAEMNLAQGWGSLGSTYESGGRGVW